MYRVISFSSAFFALFVVTTILLIGLALQAKASFSNMGATKSTIVTSELLTQPVEHYRKLSVKTNSSNSIADILQLAMTQHLLGLNSQLHNTLQSIKAPMVSQNSEWQSIYHFLVGANASKNAKYEQATKSLRLSKNLAKQINSPRLWVLATQELAFNEALQERFEQAFVLLQDAYLEAQKYQGEFELALVEQTLGGVYSYTDNYEQANKHYQQALTRYQSLQIPTYIAETLLGIATTLRHQQKWSEALQAYDNYQLAIAFQGSLGNAFYYHYGKGITLALSGRCVEASADIEAAVKAQGPRDYLGELYKKKAVCATQKGLIVEAKKALTDAKTIISTTPELIDTLWYTELLLIESDIARASGNLSLALDLFSQYHLDNARLQARKSSDNLFSLKSTLESERKDAQILQLQQQAELQSLQLIAKTNQEHKSLLVIGCAVLLLLLLIGFIFFQRRKTQLLYDLSTHDQLTKLFNRRHAITMLENWLEQHRFAQQDFSVMMIDIDNFKLINDSHGHAVGDELLVAVAQAALSVLRPSDVLARFGGEEFICILPRTKTDEAQVIAERIRKKIAITQVTFNDEQVLKRTASIGVTYVKPTDKHIKTILERADRAMYSAKESGRNQVCVN
jgi:diguanylate cyclase (GGDEF)-like protein